MQALKSMAKCESCGNDYDRLMRVELNGVVHFFDSFECAVNKLAPSCAHCSTRIMGHGVEVGTEIYCCAHCSKAAGVKGLVDHVNPEEGAQETPKEAAS